ncbi:SDR family NAD(P)-dependent oxidoreductase [Streptomyces sp. NPDC048523]|uniref:SDR family NAD(P)-dependent oxidoreductase n=1 Tax=unclassified Streptomyces TaxID=2593676 RepID=UPI00333202EA
MNPRTVVISGASSGIGLATARRFDAAGDHVINLDLSKPSAEDAVGRWIETDVTDWDAVRATVDRVAEETGSIDVVVANAGISLRRTFVDMTEKDIRRLMDINVMGVVALWQAAARHMIEARRGVLLATASTNASVGYPYYADYNASKAAVLALCRSVALELSPHVRTACVSPGYVMTPMQRAEYTDEMLAEVNAKVPANRHADPAEVASAFFYLASDEARFITGQQLIVDGGELAGGTASAHGTAFA